MNDNHIFIMAEHNRKKLADVANALEVFLNLSDLLYTDPDEMPPRWLTPSALGAVGKAVIALSDDAFSYAGALEERAAKLAKKETDQQ